MGEIDIRVVRAKLQPRIVPKGTISNDDLIDHVTAETGIERDEVAQMTEDFWTIVLEHLKKGDEVDLGGLILRAKPSRRPSMADDSDIPISIEAELQGEYRGEIANRENAGLNDEGYAQAWLARYPDDVVIMRDGSHRTGPGAETSDDTD